jgi:hypothetical protein
MALDLFANFERASNSSLFYRTTGTNPTTFVYKLSDLSAPNLEIDRYYLAQYSLNGGALSSFPVSNDSYALSANFNTTYPTICSFFAQVTSVLTKVIHTFELSAIFVREFPQITSDFIAYPSISINPVEITLLNNTNFFETSGCYFYGEGHTEKFNFVTNQSNLSDNQIKWFVGQSLDTFSLGQSAVGKTAYINLSSKQDEFSILPIHLLLTTPEFKHIPPAITYNDSTGAKQFYPFFDSTLNVTGEENLANNTTLKQSISVLPYPTTLLPVSLTSTFDPVFSYLPFDYTSQIFVTKIQMLTGSTILSEEFIGTKWNLGSVSELGEWGGEEDAFTTTPFLCAITAYQFQIGYQMQTWESTNYFNVSPLTNSTVTITVTSYKDIFINVYPNDWKKKTISQTLQTTLSTLAIPFTTLYTPNYYNLIGSDVVIEFVPEYSDHLLITKMEIDSNLLVDTLTIENPLSGALESTALTGIMQFDQVGLADLNVNVTFYDTRLSSFNEAPYIFPGYVEILDRYDEVDEAYYQTSLTPLNLTYKDQPRLSPNEWAIADNINDLLIKFYTTVEDLDLYTNLVAPKNKLIGVLTTVTDSLTSYNSWKMEATDLEYFPLSSCNEPMCCNFTEITHVPSTNRLVIAHPTAISITTNDRTPKTISTRIEATDIFNFQNIVAVDITPSEKIVVLDNTLLTVTIFNIQNDQLQFLVDWGGFGLASTPNQFNNPLDVCIDQEESIYVADTGNECIKKYTITGKNIFTLTSEYFAGNPPLSICVDVDYRIHCLTKTAVYVFDYYKNFLFKYDLFEGITDPTRITTNYSGETVYISYKTGVVRYFNTGVIAEHTIQDYRCTYLETLQGYSSVSQDMYRNLYVTVNNKILKIADVLKTVEKKVPLNEKLFWQLNQILVHKEEYIQPWVYLKAFHRMWDNIELFRNSLFYTPSGCKSFVAPTYSKQDLIIGQNEIVTNSVINRLCEQLWTNLKPLIKYFEDTCN